MCPNGKEPDSKPGGGVSRLQVRSLSLPLGDNYGNVAGRISLWTGYRTNYIPRSRAHRHTVGYCQENIMMLSDLKQIVYTALATHGDIPVVEDNDYWMVVTEPRESSFKVGIPSQAEEDELYYTNCFIIDVST